MNDILWIVIATFCILLSAQIAFGQDVYLNGEKLDGITVDSIRLSSGPTEPPVEPPTDPTACPPPSGNFRWTQELPWASGGSQEKIRLAAGQTSISRFYTTDNPEYEGHISLAAVAGLEDTTRIAWISKCPNGQPKGHKKCRVVGTSSVNIRWAQHRDDPNRCPLEPGVKHFLNVRADGAPGDYYRNLYNNDKP